MLRHGVIYLTRADFFDDKREGMLSAANLHYRRSIFASDATMAEAGYLAFREFRRMKAWTNVSCWRLDEREHERSWKEYVGSRPGVALVTTYARLARFTATLFCAKVQYEDDAWISEANSLHPFMYKRKKWDWEREYRIIEQRFPKREARFRGASYYDCSEGTAHAGSMLEVSFDELLVGVVIGPHTSQAEGSDLVGLIRDAGIRARVVRSVFSRKRMIRGQR
jgi:hypothetical protein